MLKGFCNKIVTCLSSLFKSQKNQYKQKLIELDQRVQQSKIDSRRISIYEENGKSRKNLFQKEKKQKTADTNRKDSENDIEEFGKQGKGLKMKQLNIGSLKNKNKQQIEQNLAKTKGSDIKTSKLSLNEIREIKLEKINSEGPKISPQKPRTSNNSEDSFHTLQSGSGSIISRRTFKSIKSLKNSKNSQLNSISKTPTQKSKINEIRKKYSKPFDEDQFKSIDNRQSYNSGMFLEFNSGHYQGMGANKISEHMIDWNKKQYSRGKQIGYSPQKRLQQSQLSEIVKSKLISNLLLDQLINKLQDFYTFYFQEEEEPISSGYQSKNSEIRNAYSSWNPNYCDSLTREQSKMVMEEIKTPKKKRKSTHQSYGEQSGYYFNYYIGMKCSYQILASNIQSETFNYSSGQQIHHNFSMKSIQFYCDTSSPIAFLKWYNSVQTRSKLFDFHKITLEENGVYPILQAQQYSPYYPQKNIYKLVRQIQIGTFDGDFAQEQKNKGGSQKTMGDDFSKNEYILQLEISLQNEINISKTTNEKKYVCYIKPWRNLLRFEIAERGLVEIYYESAEEINRKDLGDYYRHKWMQFQEKLSRDKIIKSGFLGGCR